MMSIPFLRNVTVIFSQNLTDIFNVFFITHQTHIHTNKTNNNNKQLNTHTYGKVNTLAKDYTKA